MSGELSAYPKPPLEPAPAFYAVFAGTGTARGVVAAIATVIASLLPHGEAALEKTGVLLLVVIGLVALLRYPGLRVPALLRYPGLISFPLYLLHQNIGYVTIRELGPLLPHSGGRILAAAIVALALAHIVHVGVEFRYRRRFEDGFLHLSSRLDKHARRLLGFS